MKSVTVRVTREDIRKGCRFGGSTCPIALAISRALSLPADVGPNNFQLCHEPLFGRTNHPLPLSAQRFIDRFDAELAVKPFSFKLRIPEGK